MPWRAETLGSSLIHHLFPFGKVWFHSRGAFPLFKIGKWRQECCVSPAVLCFPPAVFLIAASRLLFFMLVYSGVKESENRWKILLQVSLRWRLVTGLGLWAGSHTFPSQGKVRGGDSLIVTFLCTHVCNRSSKNEINPQILVEMGWLLDPPYIKE